MAIFGGKPYSFVFLQNEDDTYTGEIIEFPGCLAQGETISEAMENLVKAAETWAEAALDQGLPIPEPFLTQDFGGRVALRLPKSLHKQAARLADMDGVSLNQFLVDAIAEKVGAQNLYNHLTEQLSSQIAASTPIMFELFPKKFTAQTGETPANFLTRDRIEDRGNIKMMETANA